MSKRQNYLPALFVVVLLVIVATLHTKFLIQGEKPNDPPKQLSTNSVSVASPDEGAVEIAYPLLANLFPQDDWRRASGNLFVIGDDAGFFIFKGEPILSDDQTALMFNACTLVVLPPKKDVKTDEERYQAAFVFESNESISLTFDCSLANFTQLKAGEIGISNIKEGRVQGEIVVRSSMGTPAPDDDFELRARDVVFNLHQIVANLEVTLRYGRNYCVGRGLTIDMDVPSHLTARSVKRARPESPEEQSLQEVDELVEEGNMGNGFSLKSAQLAEITDCFRYYYKTSKESDPNATSNDEPTSFDDPYLEIRCNRGVFFSSIPDVLGGWCARFNKGVDLVSYRDGIKTEQALCETLYLYLQDPEIKRLASSSKQAKERLQRKKITGTLARLVPTRVRALKKNASNASTEDAQVEVRLETQKMKLRTDEIVYNLDERRLNLTGTEERPVRIFSSDELDSTGELKQFDFNAEFVQADISETNEIQTIFAGKNGALTTVFESAEGQTRALNVSWEKGLRIAPEPKSEGVIKLTSSGFVAFRMDGVGSFTAKEADFWCRVDSKDDSKQPKSSLTLQQVSFADKSPNGDGPSSENINEDEMFKNVKGIVPIVAEFRGDVSFNAPRGNATINEKVVLRFASELKGEKISEKTSEDDNDKTRSFFSNSSLTGDKDESQFEIQCRQTSFWCVFDSDNPQKVELRRLQLQGNVSFVERMPNDSAEKMKITAEVAQIDNPSSPNACVCLAGQTGAPALFRTNDLELAGADVFVDRASNSFRVLGSGKLDFVLPKEALDKRQKNADFSGFFDEGPVEIRWSNSMTLKNNVLSFKSNPNDRVVVEQKNQNLQCSELRLTLKNGVSLFDGDSFKQKEIDFERLDCVGSYELPVEINAYIKNQEARDGEIQEGRYYARLNNLSYLRSEDKIVSNSGGEFRAVVRAKGGFKGAEKIDAFGQNKQDDVQKNTPRLELALVHAKFQGELLGRPKLKEATATNGVRIVVGQTNESNASLDVDVPASFPEKFALITGKEASVKIIEPKTTTLTNEPSQQAIEIETRTSVVFKSSNVVGRCDKLRYSSPKNTVVMTGSGSRKAEFYRQEGPGRPKELLGEFSRASYRLDTEAFEIESFSFNGD